MSATEEFTMSGGRPAALPVPVIVAVAADSQHAQHGQPNTSAVLMEDKPLAGDASLLPRNSADDAAAHAKPAESSELNHDKEAGQGEPLAATSSKGKAREDAPDAPVPPPKEDGPESIMAIGPAQDEIKATPSGPDSGPVCNITLLLASGGRHPYKIDAKYLGRRNVAVPEADVNGNPDPFSISIYTLKELILREWRSDWEAKPASPSSIRLIYFGKLLDDKEQLKGYQFSSENPNVVHMSIRPQDLDEEEPKSGSKSLPAGHGDGAGAREGRCCIIL